MILTPETRWPENLFVLRRENWQYLSGRQRVIEPNRLTPSEKKLLGWLVLITALLAALATYLSIISLRLTEYGVTTQAAIIQSGPRPNLPGINYYVIYAFTVDGQNYEAEQSVIYTIYQRLARRGAVAEIAYMPDNPAISRLAGNNEIYTETSLAILGVIMSLGATPLAFIRLYATRRLAREGQIILGEVKTYRKDGANIHLRFTFLSPEGRRLQGIGSTTRHENDFWPAPGVPIAVIYVNENFYSMI